MATYEFSAESIKKMLGRVVRATDAAVRGAVDAVRTLEADDRHAEQDAAARVGGARAESALRTGGRCARRERHARRGCRCKRRECCHARWWRRAHGKRRYALGAR